MSFDDRTRNKLARMVGAARERLREDITAQLQSAYRMQPDGTALPLTGMTEDQRAIACALQELLEHFAALETGPEARRRAFDRMVREIGFTALNRLAALRLCEERGLVVECVRQGMSSEGFQLFERLAGGALGPRYQTYRAFLEGLFDELALDLGILFDRHTPQSRIFPAERALEDVLRLLQDPELADLWLEDETIGWIYQYYNDPAERKKMRDESQAPRNSRELAIRNQFFTPRYVVEFLTDNTLGRIWYEMRQGKTRLAEQCRYLVCRPNEVFLQRDEEPPAQSDVVTEETGGLTSEDLLLLPAYIRFRPKKDPREILMLDPAGGSGHFGLYGFDLYEVIYLEAYDDPDLGKKLREDYPDRAAFLREVPRLILAHNIHIIDIDPRACQIAGLALWLRAQRSYQQMGLRVNERPQIRKVNIVCAEPMPGENELLNEFLASLQREDLRELVRFVFERMKLAGEAGMLLRIEEGLRQKIRELENETKPLFTLDDFWGQVEEPVIEALRTYSSLAENGGATRRRLFLDDTVQGLALIDLCRKRYDTIVMNPPFGRIVESNRELLVDQYRDAWTDYYNMFLTRGFDLMQPQGRIGAVLPNRLLETKKSASIRQQLTGGRPMKLLVDLGPNVMDDAAVNALVLVAQNDGEPGDDVVPALDLVGQDPGRRASVLVDWSQHPDSVLLLSRVRRIPGQSINLRLSIPVFEVWRRTQSLDPKYASVVKGGTTFDDARFLRCWWEVPTVELHSRWLSVDTGGDYQPFLAPSPFVENWANDGREACTNAKWKYGTDAQVRQSSKFWFQPGLSYPYTSSIGFGPRAFPKGTILSSDAVAVFPHDRDTFDVLLGVLASSWTCEVLSTFGTSRKTENSSIKKLPIDLSDSRLWGIQPIVHDCYTYLTRLETGREVSPFFIQINAPSEVESIQSQLHTKLRQLDSLACYAYGFHPSMERHYEVSGRVARFINSVTSEAFAQHHLSTVVGLVFGRWDVRIQLRPSLAQPVSDPFDQLPVCPPATLMSPEGLPAISGSIVSEAWLRARSKAITLPPEGSFEGPATIPDEQYPIRIAWDGILVDDPGLDPDAEQPHADDTVRRMREVLAVLSGDRAGAIEAEACETLSVNDLRDYFRKPSGFFADHLKRYSKSRRQAPIYWPLSAASGRYTVWLYYHRLNQDTLYTVAVRYVTPKIEAVQDRIDKLSAKLSGTTGKAATALRDEITDLKGFLAELHDFRAELLRVAALPYKPDLNDGVIINAAPLHKLFRLRKWADDTTAVWKKLEAGEYDWSHMAYTIWPDRVRRACEADRSIAIAHGLEHLCKVEVKQSKRNARKPAGSEDEDEPEE